MSTSVAGSEGSEGSADFQKAVAAELSSRAHGKDFSREKLSTVDIGKKAMVFLSAVEAELGSQTTQSAQTPNSDYQEGKREFSKLESSDTSSTRSPVNAKSAASETSAQKQTAVEKAADSVEGIFEEFLETISPQKNKPPASRD